MLKGWLIDNVEESEKFVISNINKYIDSKIKTFSKCSDVSSFIKNNSLESDIIIINMDSFDLESSFLREFLDFYKQIDEVPIIFLIKDYGDLEKYIGSQKLSNIEYLIKPFNKFNLIEKIKKMVEGDENFIKKDTSFVRHSFTELFKSFMHDIGNPASVGVNVVGMLKEEMGETLTKDGEEMLDMLHDSSLFIFKLLEDMQDFLILEEIELTKERVDFYEFIKKFIECEYSHYDSKIIEVESNIDEIEIYWDREYMEKIIRILTNLILLSINAALLNIKIAKEEKSIYVNFIFSDIHEAVVRVNKFDIFKPFSKNIVNIWKKDTRLSLPIVKKIVECHFGEVGVKYLENNRVNFYFKLPLI